MKAEFGIEYGEIEDIFRKGTVFVRKADGAKGTIVEESHIDIIQEEFWETCGKSVLTDKLQTGITDPVS